MLGVSLRGLCRTFGKREVVKDLTFSVEPGELLGFLGPNGSGKSTTIRMLTTLLPPSSGDAFIGPHSIRDVAQVRREIGVVFQDPSLDLRLTAFENMDFYACLYRPRWRAPERRKATMDLLEMVALDDRANDLVRGFSWGMRRRLEIARALLAAPKVLFLDEPNTGLDPQTRAVLWDHLLSLRQHKGLTLFVATHDMEEAARCDRLAVIHQGSLVAHDTPESLCRGVGVDNLTQVFLTLTGRDPPARDEMAGTTLRGKDPTLFRRGG